MSTVNSVVMHPILKRCGIDKPKQASEWHQGFVRYMSGEYVLRVVPVVFRMQQLDNGMISLQLGDDGAMITGEAINTPKHQGVITEALLVSEKLPCQIRMSLMVPLFRRMLPLRLENQQAFSFELEQ